MADYNATLNRFSSLATQNADPAIFDTEFGLVAAASATKADKQGATFSGPIAVPAGAIGTQVPNANDVYNHSFDTGTRMPFAMTSAPRGWSQDIAVQNDSMMRVVSATGAINPPLASASGGVDSPIAGITTTAGHALAVTEMPSHTHSYTQGNSGNTTTGNYAPGAPYYSPLAATSGVSGGNGGALGTSAPHTHAIPAWTPKYIDMIICVKN